MATDFGTVISGITLTSVKFLAIGVGVLILVVGAIILSIWLYKRKKWNLSGTAVLLRNNLNEQFEDKCKGYWDAQNGWIVLKRKGYRKVHTRPFDPKIWLVGRNHFTVIQVGPEDFIIARVDFKQIKDFETNNFLYVADIIADVGKRKTWKNYTERMGKKAFTLRGWAEQHQLAITLAIVIFTIFLGFAILWMRMPSICQVAAIIPLLIHKRFR